MELFRIGFIPVTLIDVLDVLVVTFIFWKLYQIMRGTRASQMFAGLVVLFVFAILSQVLNMSGTSWLVQSVVTVWVVAFVILFQPELRRFLMQNCTSLIKLAMGLVLFRQTRATMIGARGYRFLGATILQPSRGNCTLTLINSL